MCSTMRTDPALISFVKRIEKHPCLWNYTLKDYNKREATDITWKNIASEIGDTEHNCRDRWKNIRCSFVRSQNKSKSKTRYYLADYLTFLLPYTKGKLDSDSRSIEYDERKEDKVLTDYVETTLDKAADEGESQYGIKIESVTGRCSSLDDINLCDRSVSSPSSAIDERERACKRKFTTQTTMNSIHNNSVSEIINTDVTNSANNEDADMLFFRSMMPDIKKLPDKEKRIFKRKTMTLLEDLLDTL